MKKAPIKKPISQKGNTAPKENLLMPALLALAGIILCAVFIYWPGLSNGFVYDDVAYVTENPIFQLKGSELRSKILSTPVHGNYHPLTVASLAWDYSVAQLNPERYHLHSLVLHILNSILCGLLIYLISGKSWVAAMTGILFAAHPLRVESVAWISERKDVLYAFFFFLTWICLEFYKNRNVKWAYLPAFIFFIAACASKAMAVVLPPMVVLGWYYQSGINPFLGNNLRKEYRILELIPFFLVSLAFGIEAFRVQQSFGFISNLKYTALDKVFYVAYGAVFYPIKTLFPVWLSALYPYPMGLKNTPFWEHIAALPVLLIFGALIYYFRRNRITWFVAGFYLISISIVLQIIPVGGAITADRYAYVSTVGFLFLIAFGLNYWIDEKGGSFKIPGIALFVLIIGAWTYLAAQQVKVWKSNRTLFLNVAEKFPHDPLAFYNTGNAYEKEGNYAEALIWYQKAIGNMPDYIDALYNIGSIYGRDRGMPDSGIYYLEVAVKYDPKRADAWNNLGVFNFNKKNFREALNFYKTSLEIKPTYMEAWYNQGNAYMNLGILDSARMSFEQVLVLKPDFDQAYVSLGNIYANSGNPVKQVENYQMAARYGNKDAQQWLKQNNQNW